MAGGTEGAADKEHGSENGRAASEASSKVHHTLHAVP